MIMFAFYHQIRKQNLCLLFLPADITSYSHLHFSHSDDRKILDLNTKVLPFLIGDLF